MILFWYMYLMSVDPQLLVNVNVRHGVQGDNGIGCYPEDSKISIHGFKAFLKEQHHDMKDFGESSFFYSELDNNGNIKDTNRPNFLQRYFLVEGPTRPWEVYLRKCLLSVKPMSHGRYLMKIIGLAYDTGGKNLKAYTNLERLYDHCCYKWNVNHVSQEDFNLYKGDLERSFKYRWGFVLEYDEFASFPSLSKIMLLYDHKQVPEDQLPHFFRGNREKYSYTTIAHQSIYF